eukprot:snap_masked-scaffold_22-processed-gene-2.41-mRNA-1 protein AED:1.00 eAED:1.00 QI:0/-1/0/0/-1/1/1/0/462
MPRDEEHESIQTRSKATQSLFGNEVLESVNLVSKERRKIEKLLLEMDNRKKEMQLMETSIIERQNEITKSLSTVGDKANAVPEVKTEPDKKSIPQETDNTEHTTPLPVENDDAKSDHSSNSKATTHVSRRTELTEVSQKEDSLPPPSDDVTGKDPEVTTNVESWAETGSDYVTRDAWKKKHEPFKYDYEPPSRHIGGFPLVQFPLPDKLKDLTSPAIETFLHDFKSIAQCVPTLTVQSVLIKKAADALKLRGVDMESGKKIIDYLSQHLEKTEARKRYSSLVELEKTLKWPSTKLTTDDQVYLFFDEIYNKLKYLNEKEIKAHNKRILKIVFKRLPAELNYSLDEFLLTSKSRSLTTLKKIIFSRRHCLPRRSEEVVKSLSEGEKKRNSKTKNMTREIKAAKPPSKAAKSKNPQKQMRSLAQRRSLWLVDWGIKLLAFHCNFTTRLKNVWCPLKALQTLDQT